MIIDIPKSFNILRPLNNFKMIIKVTLVVKLIKYTIPLLEAIG